ncbi:M23 family metallopeptidase [Bacillus yapensis]|uniref:M23 family metallopeptidase n=1 Tax=Bacillus yapensis TaxID=2492960 RepID=UPI0010C7A49D|nr:M23 family metallopeptidase [Bacillus yapensis]
MGLILLTFTPPCTRFVSSEFGNRSLDGFHSGMYIAKGGTVKKGQLIGYIGNTGESFG